MRCNCIRRSPDPAAGAHWYDGMLDDALHSIAHFSRLRASAHLRLIPHAPEPPAARPANDPLVDDETA